LSFKSSIVCLERWLLSLNVILDVSVNFLEVVAVVFDGLLKLGFSLFCSWWSVNSNELSWLLNNWGLDTIEDVLKLVVKLFESRLELVLELVVLLFHEMLLLMKVILDLLDVLFIGLEGLHALADNGLGVGDGKLLPSGSGAVGLLDVVEQAVEGSVIHLVDLLSILNPLLDFSFKLLFVGLLEWSLGLMEFFDVFSEVSSVVDEVLDFVFKIVGGNESEESSDDESVGAHIFCFC